MKLFVILAVVGLSSSAKLDRTYLPPSNAPTAGGSGNFLQTPNYSGPSASDYQRAGTNNGFIQNGNGFNQNGNGFPNTGNGFASNGNNFAPGANDYAQNGFDQNGPNDFNGNVNAGFPNDAQRPERPAAAFERNAAILRQDSQNDGETYSYSYETENGILAEENGVATNGVEAQGGFSYTGDDGQVYSIRYTADQNGFVPQGDHLPTPPPVPVEILKALEQNARDEAAGIFDDGTYQEGKYANGDDSNQQYTNNYGGNENYSNGNENLINGIENSGNFGNGNSGVNYNDNGFNTANDDAVVTNSAAYLPPFESQRPASRNQRPQFGNQRTSTGVQRPVTGSQRLEAGFTGQLARNQFGNSPQGNFAPTNGITNAYLPPRDQVNGNFRNSARQGPQRSTNGGFGERKNFQRRPSFNARDGYQY